MISNNIRSNKLFFSLLFSILHVFSPFYLLSPKLLIKHNASETNFQSFYYLNLRLVEWKVVGGSRKKEGEYIFGFEILEYVIIIYDTIIISINGGDSSNQLAYIYKGV